MNELMASKVSSNKWKYSNALVQETMGLKESI